MKSIGILINPVAGLGGRAGLKGSDSLRTQALALEAGYEKLSSHRAAVCLSMLQGLEGFCLLVPEGEMGGNLVQALGLPCRCLPREDAPTTREDTRHFARLYQQMGADLIVFCGGDGTARDIYQAVGTEVPVLGIPAGVKMYSGCFGVTPRSAGALLRDYVSDRPVTKELREIMDIDEARLGAPGIHPELYGYLQTLNQGARLQCAKAVSAGTPDDGESLARYHADRMKQDVLYILGPGSTTHRIKKLVCGKGTLLGVDVIRNGEMIGLDVSENVLISLLEEGTAAEILVTCIGGAGFVFGRGNQQISAGIINRVGRQNIRIVVTREKLAGLQGRPMLVDTGDKTTDQSLRGFYQIPFNSRESAVYKIDSI